MNLLRNNSGRNVFVISNRPRNTYIIYNTGLLQYLNITDTLPTIQHLHYLQYRSVTLLTSQILYLQNNSYITYNMGVYSQAKIIKQTTQNNSNGYEMSQYFKITKKKLKANISGE